MFRSFFVGSCTGSIILSFSNIGINDVRADIICQKKDRFVKYEKMASNTDVILLFL